VIIGYFNTVALVPVMASSIVKLVVVISHRFGVQFANHFNLSMWNHSSGWHLMSMHAGRWKLIKNLMSISIS